MKDSNLQFKWKATKHEQAIQDEQPFTQLQAQQQMLVRKAQANYPTLPTLPDADFWPFNERLPHIMGKWHNTVVSGLKKPTRS